MDKILGMGNALVDVMTRVPNDQILNQLNLPKGSMQLVDPDFSASVIEKTSHLNPVMTSGGSAANTIHGLAKLGIQTGFIGKVGRDALGEFFKHDLMQAGIEPYLLQSETPSGKAIALVTPDSERTFATCLGAAVELSASDLDASIFKGFQIFHIEGYLVQNHQLIETAIKLAKQQGLKVSLDLASYNVVAENLEFLKSIVSRYVDILFANEEEARSFTGLEPDEALDFIASQCEYAVVKIGKNGSLIKHKNEKTHVGIIGIDAFDTTGAGDLYAAGFLYGMVHNLSLNDCGNMGALLSGKVIETLGAKISDQGWDFIKQQMV
ncbi:MAG TPA: adenosine kinase [Marinilabiliales bacterium]|nr:MAG: sugar kinase [Bacteroidetes bacterium GWA2_40_14]OFX58863.1 MAG: sugar kinase [Bacteroidetes bacterium GWC2_40_13]OFX75606.1 MAG: sugar kinase [Bacteroidetes bacterium GWD2_40_43]OFX90676.1 MAG: sugar kinase [Bacteroidetes bacterium GWE2_40_63]OFY20846.1 MAG: sugar kinase [Bacteroidetes bacterium GWF2_40_13]OFZ23734.1 MAG: sugar kinase [Bacteroidetes bacterium RIFOXYC2_FULL_40_12]HAN00620.1 adenosine kinase [Marinilabiliales bacterium]